MRGTCGRAVCPRRDMIEDSPHFRDATAMPNTFNTLSTLTLGGETLDYYSLPALEAQFPGVATLAVFAENPAREPAAPRGQRVRQGRRHPRAGGVVRPHLAAEGNLLHAGARPAAGLHRRAVRRRSGGDARRHRRARRRSREGQPAAAGGARHRSLGAGRSLRHGRRVRAERRPRVPPQSRALRVPALGTDGLPQLPRGAAGNRHRPSGQHRVPRARRVPRTAERPDASRIPTPSSAPTRTRRW